MTNDASENDCRGIIQTLNQCPDLPFSYKDLEIDEDIFRNMKITLAPMITDEQRSRVGNLVNQYNPSATVSDSVLKGKIRLRRGRR